MSLILSNDVPGVPVPPTAALLPGIYARVPPAPAAAGQGCPPPTLPAAASATWCCVPATHLQIRPSYERVRIVLRPLTDIGICENLCFKIYI